MRRGFWATFWTKWQATGLFWRAVNCAVQTKWGPGSSKVWLHAYRITRGLDK